MEHLEVDEITNIASIAEASLSSEHPYITSFKAKKSSLDSLKPSESRHGSYWPTLNPNVARCVSFAPQHLFPCDLFCRNAFKDYYLQWDELSLESLTADPSDISNLDYGDFTEVERRQYHAAIRLKQLSAHIFTEYTSAGSDSVASHYRDIFDSLYSYYYPRPLSLFDKVFDQDDSADVRVEFTIAVAALERFLGDIFTNTCASKDIPCPRILRDLLATPELATYLPQNMISTLVCVIGAPSCLNLRNLTWHGFVSSSEFPKSFLALLLSLMVSVGKFVLDKATKIVPRPLLKLEPIEESFLDFGMGSRIFPAIDTFFTAYRSSILKLARESCFVVPSCLKSVENAFCVWADPDAAKDSLRIHRFVAEMLPPYEHAIRRIFICSNSLSSHLFCAVSRGYFTTMDMFLEKYLDINEDSSCKEKPINHLIAELGNPFSQLLFDLFTHPAGRRPRDRLSHGEADIFSINGQFLDRFIGSFIALCLHYHPQKNSESVDFWALFPSDFRRCYEFCFEKYVSCFHPRSMLQKSLVRLPSAVESMRIVVDLFPPRPSNSEEEDPEKTYRRNEYPDVLATFQKYLADLEALQSLPPMNDVLYRRDSPFTESAELIALNALTSITRSFFTSCDSFTGKKEEFDRVLSAEKVPVRQRAAFSKFLGAMEVIQGGIKSCGVALAVIEASGRGSPIVFPVKVLNRIISILERYLRSFSENNWSGSVEQIAEAAKLLVPLATGKSNTAKR